MLAAEQRDGRTFDNTAHRHHQHVAVRQHWRLPACCECGASPDVHIRVSIRQQACRLVGCSTIEFVWRYGWSYPRRCIGHHAASKQRRVWRQSVWWRIGRSQASCIPGPSFNSSRGRSLRRSIDSTTAGANKQPFRRLWRPDTAIDGRKPKLEPHANERTRTISLRGHLDATAPAAAAAAASAGRSIVTNKRGNRPIGALRPLA